MREYKFRGKRKDTGEWVYGSLLKTIDRNKQGDAIIKYYICFSLHCLPKPSKHMQIEVIPETVGEFTSLCDKNGKEIYEGDIVQNDGYSELCIVEPYQGQFVGRYKPQTPYYNYDESLKLTQQKELSYVGLGFYVCERNAIEVIGNITDNKDLLGVQE